MLHKAYITSEVTQDNYHSVITTDPGDELLSLNLMDIPVSWVDIVFALRTKSQYSFSLLRKRRHILKN